MPTSRIKDPIRGKTFRWRWTDGPVANMAHEHVRYAVLPVADDVYLVSYKTSSGDTLTAALNFRARSLVAITSSRDAWYPAQGTFEVFD